MRKEREGVRQEDHLESGVSLSYIVSFRPGQVTEFRLPFQNKSGRGVEKMAQWVRTLAYKHKDQSSTLQ